MSLWDNGRWMRSLRYCLAVVLMCLAPALVAAAPASPLVGTLVYGGAIEDRPTTRRGDVPGAQNYVRDALQSVATGQPVKMPQTRAYGCTVKYS
jgi:hypothetical protein